MVVRLISNQYEGEFNMRKTALILAGLLATTFSLVAHAGHEFETFEVTIFNITKSQNFAFLFYRLIQRISKTRIPEDSGDFRLLSRRAVDSLKRLREQHRFMKGLFAWIGYPQKEVPYRRAPRCGGRTKWNYWGLWNFAVEGITSFSLGPLKIATYLGLLTCRPDDAE